MKLFAIRHEGEKKRYVEFPPFSTPTSGFNLVPRLNASCVMDKDQANGFLKRPGTDARYKLVNLTVTVEKPLQVLRPKKKPKASPLTPDEFNKLSSRNQWDVYKRVKGIFRCPDCNNKVSYPRRCEPYHGASLHCGDCDYELTRRTGGGQSDPFNFKLCEEEDG
jgi:hypothetical protein